MKNIIQLRNGFVNFQSTGNNNYTHAMSVQSELMKFGFILDQSALTLLSAASIDEIVTFHKETISYLKEATGATRNFTPFWKNFPNDVMSKTEAELWAHQLAHYFTDGAYEPTSIPENRGVAFEQPSYTTITAGDEKRFEKIFTDLVSVNNSLSPKDLEVVQWFVTSKQNLVFPSEIPFKENLCTLASFGLDVPVKTVTDVLRIAVSMSGGDISLPKVPSATITKRSRWSKSEQIANPYREAFKFKNFKRSERIYLLSLLEKTNCSAEEMQLKKNRWIRLGEILHVGQFSNRFPKSYKAFTLIRNQKDSKVRTWNSKVETAFESSFKEGMELLSTRSGELFRRIDYLVRSNMNNEANLNIVLSTIEAIADKVSNKVLFEVFSHFEKRMVAKTSRSIMIKGSRKRTALKDLPAIDKSIVDRIQRIVLKAIRSKFAKLPSLGKVWIDEELKKIPLPTNMRSTNPSLKPRIRGQRIPMGNPNAKVIRAYLHWFDPNGREDLDLAAILVGMGKVGSFSWNSRHNTGYGCHSGDIRYRQGACAEYIDIHVENALKDGFRYVLLQAFNYEKRGFDTMKECVFGVTEREYPTIDQSWLPSTITDAIQLQSTATRTIMSIIDLETNEYIFLDLDSEGTYIHDFKHEEVLGLIKDYSDNPKVSVYDLLEMHATTRGNVISDKSEADKTFEYSDFSTNYVETMKLMLD